MNKPTILIAGGDEAEFRSLAKFLMRRDFQVHEKVKETDISGTFCRRPPDLAIIGSYRDDAARELALAEQIRQLDKNVPLILITLHSSEVQAVAALKVGINDYFKWPCSNEELLQSIKRRLTEQWQPTSAGPQATKFGPGNAQPMIGESPSIKELRMFLFRAAATESTVLITGETGTGKELVARLIHQHSPRREQPLISVNCSTLPDSLLESELFGYERGAFTGAHSSYPGKLKLADGGTFFFDEIGDMSPYAQAKVLRCLESREVYRLGGRKSVPLNIRVIAATNQNLERLITGDRFRKDLYFRLNVARVHLSPLRERKEDIPILFDHYLQGLNQRCGRKVSGLCAEALDCLLHYDWPGNVRELRNFVEAIFINPPEGMVSVEDFPASFAGRSWENAGVLPDERELLLSTLFSTNWNKSEAAKKLHWSRMTLYRKMQKYDIQSGSR